MNRLPARLRFTEIPKVFVQGSTHISSILKSNNLYHISRQQIFCTRFERRMIRHFTALYAECAELRGRRGKIKRNTYSYRLNTINAVECLSLITVMKVNGKKKQMI